MKRVLFFIVTIFLVMVSCSVDFLQLKEEILSTSIQNGQWLKSGQNIKLVLEDLAIEQLRITIENETGYSVISSTISTFDSNYKIPEYIEDGLYNLLLEDYTNGDVSTYQRIPIFIFSGEYEISDIVIYPPLIQKEKPFYAEALTTFPEGSNPYLRWRLDDQVITEGYLDQGTSYLSWVAQGGVGIFKLSVEIFPSYIEDSIYSEKINYVELFVGSNGTSGSMMGMQTPDNNPYLFPLNSSLENSGSANISLADRNATTAVFDGYNGYNMSSNSSLTANKFILPVEGGKLQPFSISLNIKLSEMEEGTPYNILTTREGEFSFSILIDEQRQVLLVMENGTRFYRTVIGNSSDLNDKLSVLTISSTPADDFFQFRWFLDGRIKGAQAWDVGVITLSGSGETAIGSTYSMKGFNGFLDEWSIFFDGSRADDPALFQKVMSYLYKGRVILSESYNYNGADGAYWLQPGESSSLGVFPLQASSLLELKWSGRESDFQLVIKSREEGVKYVTINPELYTDELDVEILIEESENGFEIYILNGYNGKTLLYSGELSTLLECVVETKESGTESLAIHEIVVRTI